MMRRFFIAALVLLIFAGRAFAISAPQLYTANYGGAGILSWPPSTTGNVAPTTSITGVTTTIGNAAGVAIDGSGNIWAADYTNQKILKFNAGSTGNIAPTVTITAPAGGNVRSLAFDSNGYLYALDGTKASLYIYSPAQIAATGSPTPNILVGGSTTFGSVVDLAIGADNKIYVTDDSTAGAAINSIDIFAASTAGGGTAPIATIAGTNTTLVNVSGIGVDSSNNVYVTDIGATNKVFKWAVGSTGNVAPGGTITTSLNTPRGIVVDSSGNIYVANEGNNTITVYNSGGTLIQTISGASTLLNTEFQLALWLPGGVTTGKGFFFAP